MKFSMLDCRCRVPLLLLRLVLHTAAAAVGCVTLSSLSELTHTYIHKAAQCSTIIKIAELCPKTIQNQSQFLVPTTKKSEEIKAVMIAINFNS